MNTRPLRLGVQAGLDSEGVEDPSHDLGDQGAAAARDEEGVRLRPRKETVHLYVADSKLCSSEAMRHIDAKHGRFVTVIPHGRKEDTFFKDWVQTHVPAWEEADRRPGARLADPDRVWRIFEAPVPSTDGYRVIWAHSSGKAAREAASRSARIEAGLSSIETLQARLSSPKSRIKTR